LKVSTPKPVEIIFQAPEQILDNSPLRKKLPPREWAPRPLDQVNPDYPEVVRIQQIVAKHFAVDIYDLLKPGKEGRGSNRVASARRVAIYFCWKQTGQSYPFLGRCFGRRDHTTIMYSVRRCEQLIETDSYAAADIRACEALL